MAQIDAGRLWAYVKPTHATTADPGHIISVDAINATASSTVSNGKGVIAWASGNYYVGEIKDGLVHGEGTWTYADGGKYVGQFKDDKMHGECTFTYANGDTYIGQYKDGQRHGLGKYTFASGKVDHDGEWVNGQPEQ